MGYVNAGNAVLNGTDIYADFLNTWPPFFAIFSVPLALVHNWSPLLIRGIWLMGIALSWIGIVRMSTWLFDVQMNRSEWWRDWRVLLPFILVFRFVIEDISNIQINSMLLFASLGVFRLLDRGRWVMASLLLAFIISLKVYPIFILFYLLYKRNLKPVGATVVGIFAINALCFPIMGGLETHLAFHTWIEHRLLGDPIILHKNQAFLPFGIGLLSDVTRGLGIQYNIMSLPLELAKVVSQALLLILLIPFAWWMRSSWKSTPMNQKAAEIAVVLALIPIASPLAWKYYFVFLFPLYFVAVSRFQNPQNRWISGLIILSFILTILTTEGVIQRTPSDVAEVFGAITWGVLLQVYLFRKILKTSRN